MSETPSRRPRHARSDGGRGAPVQGGPGWPTGSAAQGRYQGDDGPAPWPSRARRTAVPAPTPPGDDLFTPGADARTQALPVIPRPRQGGVPHARLPEPFRPAPVRGTGSAGSATGSARTGSLGLPELPAAVRPVLPAVLGAATALILALGVVAAVNGAGAPATVPVPPVPVTAP